MPSQIKVSEIPGYLDQIQTGGGTEIDLSQFEPDFTGALLLFTEIADYHIDSLEINGTNISQKYWMAYSGGIGTTIFIICYKSYPDPVEINLNVSYDYDSGIYKYKNIIIRDNALSCVNGGTGEMEGFQ